MGGNFEFIEIIVFAAVAAFLVYRLGSVLGKRTGNERRHGDTFAASDKKGEAKGEKGGDNVISLPDRGEAPADIAPDSPLAAGVAAIRTADPSFEVNTFLDGAQKAFEMIVNAFTAGDGKTLNMLLSPEVYENFAGAIRARELAHQTRETTLVGIKSADVIEAELEGSEAHVTVKFVSEQIDATMDENGTVIEGDPNNVDEVTDIWTFARDTRASDPNWKLIATRSPN